MRMRPASYLDLKARTCLIYGMQCCREVFSVTVVGGWKICRLIIGSFCWSVRVNVCPFQGSRTIRTEEAVLISLAKFGPYLTASGQTKSPSKKVVSSSSAAQQIIPAIEFSDDRVSEESSDSGSSDSE
jgi:Putative RNA methyltransferase